MKKILILLAIAAIAITMLDIGKTRYICPDGATLEDPKDCTTPQKPTENQESVCETLKRGGLIAENDFIACKLKQEGICQDLSPWLCQIIKANQKNDPNLCLNLPLQQKTLCLALSQNDPNQCKQLENNLSSQICRHTVNDILMYTRPEPCSSLTDSDLVWCTAFNAHDEGQCDGIDSLSWPELATVCQAGIKEDALLCEALTDVSLRTLCVRGALGIGAITTIINNYT